MGIKIYFSKQTRCQKSANPVYLETYSLLRVFVSLNLEYVMRNSRAGLRIRVFWPDPVFEEKNKFLFSNESISDPNSRFFLLMIQIIRAISTRIHDPAAHGLVPKKTLHIRMENSFKNKVSTTVFFCIFLCVTNYNISV